MNMNMKSAASVLLFQFKTQHKRLCDLLWT